MRSADSEHEVPLASCEHVAGRDPLGEVVIGRLLAGVSSRRSERTREPVGSALAAGERSVSKPALSRTFISRTREGLLDRISRPLSDMRLAIDGIEFRGRCCVVALGIASDGVKVPLGCGTVNRERHPH